mmetsp:Transcript_2418/g.4769  ORF Transcript_2418/g.4769 Transcript_2418/m.4769 type:complete len:225 (-) Transcript_2418:47-721(-)
MEGLKRFSALVAIFQLFLHVKSGKPNISCKAGLEYYDNGACMGCMCTGGHGLNVTQMSWSDGADYTKCAPCVACRAGQFSNPTTKHLCVNCSKSCDTQNKITIRHCDGQNDEVCGKCLKGFIMDQDHNCLSVDDHGRKTRQKLKEEDHTVYFVLTAVLIPMWMGLICYCIFRNKIGSWRRGSKQKCSDSVNCRPHLIYAINADSVMLSVDSGDVASDERALITD